VSSADQSEDNRFARLCATFLVLLGQPLSEWEEQEPPRHMQRQAERTGQKIRTIRTVVLRRPRTTAAARSTTTGTGPTAGWSPPTGAANGTPASSGTGLS